MERKKSVSKKKPEVADKKISTKNYVYALLILVGGILIVLYIFEWFNVKNEEKFMTSYLISSNTIDSSIEDLDSLDQVLNETPSSYFIYFSYTKDEHIYNFEKDLKKVIDNYGLSDNFYYVDLTDMMEKEENYLESIENKLNIKLDKVPAIIYVRDGKILDENILDGVSGTLLKISDIEKLLDIYDFEQVK